jgi:hypothetical protein
MKSRRNHRRISTIKKEKSNRAVLTGPAVSSDEIIRKQVTFHIFYPYYPKWEINGRRK